MRFINKLESPACLTQLAKQHEMADQAWNTLQNPQKTKIHEQILQKEQQGLCAYCERKINQSEDSHLEHIYPQSSYKHKRFDYANLIVSCNGEQCLDIDQHIYKDIDHDCCGHRKDNQFEPAKFLNPVEQTDIEDYFIYDRETGSIKASNKQIEKSTYTIELLNLCSPRLNIERKNAYAASQKAIKHVSLKQYKVKLKILLNAKEMPSFVSYLRCCYSKFL